MRELVTSAGMQRTSVVVCAALAAAGCMTFETTVPGVLDLRSQLAQPRDAPAERQRSAFGDDGAFEGFVLIDSTDAPTQGEYKTAPRDAVVYRHIVRQWFILGVFPIVADPTVITEELSGELSVPGSRITDIRIASGMDLVDIGRVAAAVVFSWTGVANLLLLVPTRTTEVVAFVHQPPAGFSRDEVVVPK